MLLHAHLANLVDARVDLVQVKNISLESVRARISALDRSLLLHNGASYPPLNIDPELLPLGCDRDRAQCAKDGGGCDAPRVAHPVGRDRGMGTSSAPLLLRRKHRHGEQRGGPLVLVLLPAASALQNGHVGGKASAGGAVAPLLLPLFAPLAVVRVDHGVPERTRLVVPLQDELEVGMSRRGVGHVRGLEYRVVVRARRRIGPVRGRRVDMDAPKSQRLEGRQEDFRFVGVAQKQMIDVGAAQVRGEAHAGGAVLFRGDLAQAGAPIRGGVPRLSLLVGTEIHAPLHPGIRPADHGHHPRIDAIVGADESHAPQPTTRLGGGRRRRPVPPPAASPRVAGRALRAARGRSRPPPSRSALAGAAGGEAARAPGYGRRFERGRRHEYVPPDERIAADFSMALPSMLPLLLLLLLPFDEARSAAALARSDRLLGRRRR
mmetsp:Transcript_50301/g.151456  ORF Transcript_50301/g.151456 Transcript_50301/m.151456 type:complete len:434 (+) Transcript_50301:142-1443(+)